jgi:thiol-disulfide isomerase/thioredoxin
MTLQSSTEMAIRFTMSCLMLVTLCACSSAPANREDLVAGAQAPDFSLPMLDGEVLNSKTLKGNIVVLNFWATWCQPCMAELPVLKDLAATSRVKIIGIALDEEGAKVVKPFVADHGINYPVVIGDQDVFEQFNGLAIPYSLLLDSSQHIVKIYRGPISKEEIDQDLKSMASGN